ncbi:MAG: class I SAM-dependent methyltransferase [Chloroflexota bacterium]|nr:class I SAM-dependent methyltransferase [Chloroflexota bacterium]
MSYDQNALTYDELKRLDDRVGPIKGWDFSRMRTIREPVPWDYHEVARRYLSAGSRVLDVGTGGGEQFLRLAPYFGSGVGADPDTGMLDAARENAVAAVAAGLPEGRVTFEPMPEDALPFQDDSFDVVLLRHAPVLTNEVLRVLRPGGVFVTQGVGRRNMRNICRVFGVTAYGEALPGPPRGAPAPHDATPVGESFDVAGRRATVLVRGEYDVRYFVRDAESLLFWLKALSHLASGGFTIERHWQQVAQIIRNSSTPDGIQTNEHRSLLILRKE